jgi:hypothetical protein
VNVRLNQLSGDQAIGRRSSTEQHAGSGLTLGQGRIIFMRRMLISASTRCTDRRRAVHRRNDGRKAVGFVNDTPLTKSRMPRAAPRREQVSIKMVGTCGSDFTTPVPAPASNVAPCDRRSRDASS